MKENERVSNSLDKKKILVVDDEPDVLETVEEVLEMCQIETAGSYDKALRLLESESYDMAILDVMGVKGLDLLDEAVRRNVPSLMLTAPAFTPQYILESMQRGAVSCLPKQELATLDSWLSELFGVMERGDSPWLHTMQRLEPLLDERFPPDWKQKYKDLWNPKG